MRMVQWTSHFLRVSSTIATWEALDLHIVELRVAHTFSGSSVSVYCAKSSFYQATHPRDNSCLIVLQAPEGSIRSEKSKREEVGCSSTINLESPVSGILNFTSCHLLDTHNLAFAPRLLAPFIQQKNERRTASCGTVPGAFDLGRGSVTAEPVCFIYEAGC